MANNTSRKIKKTVVITSGPRHRGKKMPQYSLEDLTAGLESRFWKVMEFAIKHNIDFLKRQVYEAESLTPKQRSDLRDWAKLNENLLDLPRKLIAGLEAGEVDPINLDPYATVYDQIRNDARPTTNDGE